MPFTFSFTDLLVIALPAASTVLQGNALASRKKSLQLFRSSIHAWGVRTTEPLLAGELVIEYIGEIISARVADIREKQYERSGIGSSYFFKVDDDMIIDATKQVGPMNSDVSTTVRIDCGPSGQPCAVHQPFVHAELQSAGSDRWHHTSNRDLRAASDPTRRRAVVRLQVRRRAGGR